MSSILKVDTIQDQSGNNIINENAGTITIGASGDTISIPAGATLTGAGAGLVWQSVKTADFTAVKGEAYPVNTTSDEIKVTLPATPSAGDQVQLVDYAGTFDSNQLIIDPNGEDIEGQTDDLVLRGEREGVILTYIDSTQGWIATSGINEGTDALEPNVYSVDFLVIAGGGGGGSGESTAHIRSGGGGGAGGYRNSFSTETSGGGGSSEASLTFSSGTVYTITVGAGGAGTSGVNQNGTVGVDSSISGSGITTITSSGGGFGGAKENAGGSGGSGGGGGSIEISTSGGSGTANQGFDGGDGESNTGGGGGGASQVGTAGDSSIPIPGDGGNGLASSITGTSVTRGGGGGGGGGSAGTGGTGGGGAGGSLNASGTAGVANTGGGGGGAGNNSGTQTNGAAGGKGVVILRMPTARYSGTTTGSPTVGTDGTDTILTFNDSGSYTA
jgi:hypothetical protein